MALTGADGPLTVSELLYGSELVHWWGPVMVKDDPRRGWATPCQTLCVPPLSLWLSFFLCVTHTHTHTDTLTHSFYWHLPTGCSFLFIDGFRLGLLCRDTQSRDRHSTSFWVFMNPIFFIFFFFFAVYNVLLFHWLTNVGFHLSLKESAKNQSENRGSENIPTAKWLPNGVGYRSDE